MRHLAAQFHSEEVKFGQEPPLTFYSLAREASGLARKNFPSSSRSRGLIYRIKDGVLRGYNLPHFARRASRLLQVIAAAGKDYIFAVFNCKPPLFMVFEAE
ncbi:hypothetical protein CDAR_461311 [Caerostris darwini]|uniref:Uncharacterized protein n=1 Tax=Caerostris darwini TaxID=1538125 RepID=A0AAV4SE07_9ARAC|nr:hypothetical protein CDAR_461311 [Caerostris darwini]